jgi:crossover junction endodeoxyribonuclease RuvC
MKILGIDPGTRIVGYGLLDVNNGKIRPVDYGIIKVSDKLSMPLRLKDIYTGLIKLYKKLKPDEVVVENIFYARDASATIKIGEARGIVLLSAVMNDLPIHEYTPSEIKKAVTGNGLAHKIQVQKMVGHILSLKELPKPYDISDALAIALCHVYRGNRYL